MKGEVFMKNFARMVLSLVLSLCLFFGFSTISFAASLEQAGTSSSDEIILYQDENVKLYQSKAPVEESNQAVAAMEDNYGNVWLTRDGMGSFLVRNTHTGRIGVTWKVESSNPSDFAQIYMTTSSGLVVLATQRVKPSDGDVRLQINNGVSLYNVHYIATTQNGMRIMCWTYKL